MRFRLFLLLLSALVLSACSGSKPVTEPPVPQPGGAVSQPATETHPAAGAPAAPAVSPVDGVPSLLAKASDTASYNYLKAAGLYDQALALEPGNKEASKSLAALRAEHPDLAPATIKGDVDGDGVTDSITVDLLRVTIRSGGGKTLYEGLPFEDLLPNWEGITAEVSAVPTGPPLVHLQMGVAVSYWDHRFLWYNGKTRRVEVISPAIPSSIWTAEGDGRFSAAFRSGSFMEVEYFRWDNGVFRREDDQNVTIIKDRVGEGNLWLAIKMILDLKARVSNPEALFASPPLYAAFQQQTKDGVWTVPDTGPEGLEPVGAGIGRLTLTSDSGRKLHLDFSQANQQIVAVAAE